MNYLRAPSEVQTHYTAKMVYKTSRDSSFVSISHLELIWCKSDLLAMKQCLYFFSIVLAQYQELQYKKLNFKVYRILINKSGLINFYSHENQRINLGFLIGFYLRVLKICCTEYLNEKQEYFEKTFIFLHDPHHIIFNARKQAHKIHNAKTHTPPIALQTATTQN